MPAKKTQTVFALVYGSPNPIALLSDGGTISRPIKPAQGIKGRVTGLPLFATRFTIPPRTFPTFPVLTYLDGSLLAK